MRILLDECLPARLRRDLPGHDVQTVPQAGWASIKNGKLLRLIAASGKFDVFLTVDKNLPREQKIEGLPFAVVVLRAKSNRLADVVPFAPELIRRLPEFQPGHVYVLSGRD
jgi:predicted nuclease of predicted toxin-antitoxin system